MSMLRNPDSLLNRAYRAVGKRALDLVPRYQHSGLRCRWLLRLA